MKNLQKYRKWQLKTKKNPFSSQQGKKVSKVTHIYEFYYCTAPDKNKFLSNYARILFQNRNLKQFSDGCLYNFVGS